MRRVVIESPYAGDVERNVRYARASLSDCLRRGEAPLASHLLYAVNLEVEGTIKIPLTRGYTAIVGRADAERVLAFKWLALGRDGQVYAARKQRYPGGQDTIFMHRFLLGAHAGVEEPEMPDYDVIPSRRWLKHA